MPIAKTKPYTKKLKETMLRKSEILSKAQVFWEVGMMETAQGITASYQHSIML